MALTHPNFVVDTTFSGKNIAAAASVYDYTFLASMFAQISVALTVVGNGDYVAYLTRQWVGVGSVYVLLPKTTGASASGETGIEFTTLIIEFKVGDVIAVMIDGLTGDNSVAGKIRIVQDNPSIFQAADTVANVTTVASVTALAAGAIPDNEIDAGSIKADAVTKIQSGLSTLTAAQVWSYATRTLSSYGTLIADIWSYSTRTLSSFGALIADFWSYASRTLTQSAAEAAESTNPGTLALKRGDSWSQAITDLGSLVGYTYLDFTVKRSEKDLDADAIIRIRKAASGLSDGLLTLNGTTGTAANGSIVIDDETLGNITFALAATATDDLELDKGLYYDIQKITGAAVITLGSGVLNVTADITRAVT